MTGLTGLRSNKCITVQFKDVTRMSDEVTILFSISDTPRLPPARCKFFDPPLLSLKKPVVARYLPGALPFACLWCRNR